MPQTRRRRVPLYSTELLQSPLYSQTCKDAFRTMAQLAAAAKRRPGSVRNLDALAAETGMSTPALAQVIHFLQLAGLVEAPHRASGGLRLARPASQISLLEVVRAIDGAGLWGRCVLGLAQCADDAPCPAHMVWKRTRRMLELHLQSQSLVELIRALDRRRHLGRSPTRS
jgi:Rrf2 family iron-sulfur cluster assembly transcriptional regulator